MASVFLATVGSLTANAAPISNVDSGLQRLYTHALTTSPSAASAGAHAQIAPVDSATITSSPGRFDSSSRVLVHVLLNGLATTDTLKTQLGTLGANVLGISTTYRHGIMAAYLPTDQIANAAALTGVRALAMEYKPATRVGKYTSQGASVLGTSTLNQSGLKGDGITVGVISDSFNTSYENTANPPVTTASQDVATGDLPVVNVLEDFPNGTDEGRAMCQIVYDEAPHCNLAFATADVSEVDFANNIVQLRTTAKADVIVDDVGYFDEPVFSDGLVAQAVDEVATSTSIAGKPVAYCSSAGNDGNNGYRNSYRNLTDASVRAPGHHGNLKLNVTDTTSPNYLAPSLTAGGWYNWSTTGASEPTTTVEAPGPTTYEYAIFLQWDDLFDQDHGVTTTYNFLVFDASGNYQAALSSTTDAFNTQQPIQAIGYLLLGTPYQIAITKTKQVDSLAGPIPATHQLALYTTLDGASFLTGKYFYPAPLNVPNMYGHPQADGAIACAAYVFSYKSGTPYIPEIENFTSPGPATIYFDQNYQRLTKPIVRQKPEVSGVDGVVNTFFGAPYYNYPFAFFGTSAAAPSVAGVAALIIQDTGGPGSIPPATVKEALELSPNARNGVVETTQALGTNSAGTVSVTALGQSYFGPQYFTVAYSGSAGHSITSLTINGAGAGVIFDGTSFALGKLTGISSGAISVLTPTAGSSSVTLKFKSGTFKQGVSFQFSVSQDVAGTYTGYTQNEFGAGCESEDLAYGATFTAQFASTSDAPITKPFAYEYLTTGYLSADGYGLVNAVNAINLLSTSASASTSSLSQK